MGRSWNSFKGQLQSQSSITRNVAGTTFVDIGGKRRSISWLTNATIRDDHEDNEK